MLYLPDPCNGFAQNSPDPPSLWSPTGALRFFLFSVYHPRKPPSMVAHMRALLTHSPVRRGESSTGSKSGSGKYFLGGSCTESVFYIKTDNALSYDFTTTLMQCANEHTLTCKRLTCHRGPGWGEWAFMLIILKTVSHYRGQSTRHLK